MENQEKKQVPRRLTTDEIDVRVAQTTERNGAVSVNLLLYKDARVDMRILDELYGPMNWKRTHQLIGDRLYCTIEVRDPATGEWIAKQDVGTESNTEPERGQASDAFKRAGFNWGIGRELYTAPTIKVELENSGYEFGKNGNRIQVWAAFHVGTIGYDDAGNINSLTILDRINKVRYDMNAKKGQNSTRNSQAGNYTTQGQRAQNSPIPGAATGTQAPAPAPRRRTVTLAAVEKGQAKRLISELSQRDYDDMRDWAAGLDALKAQYDYEPAALQRIQELAVEERNARLQTQVPAIEDLP